MTEHKTRYQVSTRWGCFSLDEGAYRDYLAGKLWLSWSPRTAAQTDTPTELQRELPTAVCAEALRLRERTPPEEVYRALQLLRPGARVAVPYRSRMCGLSIDEMTLSVRASNCLMRAGAVTFGKLHALMCREGGLRRLRNLGAKSEKEIGAAFLSACYRQLTAVEQAAFWQEILDKETEAAHGVV